MDTTWLGKLGRLLRGERAGVATVAAIMLTVMVGMIGAVVDLPIAVKQEALTSNGSPVCGETSSGASSGAIVGFAHLIITEVRNAPYKEITAMLQCGLVVPGSTTGGGKFGSRATPPSYWNRR